VRVPRGRDSTAHRTNFSLNPLEVLACHRFLETELVEVDLVNSAFLIALVPFQHFAKRLACSREVCLSRLEVVRSYPANESYRVKFLAHAGFETIVHSTWDGRLSSVLSKWSEPFL
jgi:hypothetical protein